MKNKIIELTPQNYKTKTWGRRGIPNDDLLSDNKFREVMVGCMLGDGCIYIPKDYKNAYYQEHADNIEYLKWKGKILSRWLKVKIYQYNIKSKFPRGTEKIFLQGFLFTNASQSLTYLKKIWYPNDKKGVPESELGYLNGLGLAIWLCDDGSHYNEVVFHTDGFSLDDLDLLKEFFFKKFGIRVRLDKSSHLLKITKRYEKKFIELIKPFVPNVMHYKLESTLKRSPYMSVQHKNKISESVEQAWRNPLIRNRMISAMRGVPKKLTPEYRQKLRERAKTLVLERWK
ncbi:MAG: hypothetical protein ACE5K4_10700 [Candidatus Hydrothermarchaeota archaeon]